MSKNKVSGLSVLSSSQVSRPHPGDNPLVFLFLVGGVTPSEIRLIKETVATQKPGTQVSLQESCSLLSNNLN